VTSRSASKLRTTPSISVRSGALAGVFPLLMSAPQLRAEGEDVPEEYLAHISPLTWDHVNLLGQYTFNPATARSLEDLRPLRTGAEADGDDALAA
jgi:Tn3 transposase DDE domain-containing protein